VFAAAGTGEGGDAGDWAAIPQGYFAMGVGQNLSLGIGVNIPFGLKTDYDAGWRGQRTALKSDLKTYNINPVAAYRINNWFSVGAGLSYQRIEAELTSFASAAAGGFTLKASDGSWGWNLGALFQPAESVRVGVAYRSAIGHKLEGDATFTILGALNGGVAADIKMPAAVSLSASGAVNSQWDLMGDITWTRWSDFKQLNVVRTTGATTGALLTFLPFNWRDTTRYSIGANYKPNSTWKIRFGVALDETPTNDVDRTPRLPDQDRTWLAFGAQYKLSKAGAIDFGYAHEFIKDATVNSPVPTSTCAVAGCLNGKFSNQADIISIQYSHSF
jgi:long-chain fatty acid transport protein